MGKVLVSKTNNNPDDQPGKLIISLDIFHITKGQNSKETSFLIYYH